MTTTGGARVRTYNLKVEGLLESKEEQEFLVFEAGIECNFVLITLDHYNYNKGSDLINLTKVYRS